MASGAFVVDVAGTESHLGKVTAHYTGVATPTGPNTISISGSSVEVAANGDKLYATLSGSATLDAAFNAQGTLVNTFTGGTGRFEHASGVRGGHVQHGDALLRRRDAHVRHRPLPGGHRQLLSRGPASRRAGRGLAERPLPPP